MTAKERLFFHFRDVVGNKGHELRQGTRVTYKTRTNDSTMEKEAYEVELEGRGGGGGGGASGERRGAGGRGGGGAWKPSFKSRGASSEGSTSGSSTPSASSSATAKKKAIKEAASRVNNATQRSGNNRDQFGREQQFNAGSLLSIVGLEGADGAVAKTSKSPDDWDPQMERYAFSSQLRSCSFSLSGSLADR